MLPPEGPSPVRGSFAVAAAAVVGATVGALVGAAPVVGVEAAADLVGVVAGAAVFVAAAGDAVGVAAYVGAGPIATAPNTTAANPASPSDIHAYFVLVNVFNVLPLLLLAFTAHMAASFLTLASADEPHMKAG